VIALKFYLVIKNGAITSADLGNSSSYSNEIKSFLLIMCLSKALASLLRQ